MCMLRPAPSQPPLTCCALHSRPPLACCSLHPPSLPLPVAPCTFSPTTLLYLLPLSYPSVAPCTSDNSDPWPARACCALHPLSLPLPAAPCTSSPAPRLRMFICCVPRMNAPPNPNLPRLSSRSWPAPVCLLRLAGTLSVFRPVPTPGPDLPLCCPAALVLSACVLQPLSTRSLPVSTCLNQHNVAH